MLNHLDEPDDTAGAARLRLVTAGHPQPAAVSYGAARFGIATAWLIVGLAASLATGHLAAGAAIVAATVATELLAENDDFGSKASSGVLSMVAVIVLGWPAGIVVGLGSVAFGDLIVRQKPLALVAWWGILVAAMLTSGAWSVAVSGTITPSPWPPRVVAVISFGVFLLWTSRRLRDGSAAYQIAPGIAVLAVVAAALSGPWWTPYVSDTMLPWVGAGMVGLGLAAAFMLCDCVGASAAAWRRGGWPALSFWDQHLPTLFFRYAGQGIVAGIIAYVFETSGWAALDGLLAGVIVAQSLYFVFRRADAAVESAVSALSSALDARDPYTAGHSVRVADYAVRVALHLGWSKATVECVRKAGLLHDVGKLGVADDVLLKPGKLTHDEFEHMKRHASVGATIVSRVQGLGRVSMVVGQDHERWEGGGYPNGLVRDAILPEARLIAVADVYDAMTTARPYRDALPEEDVLCHLEAEAGKQLDPALVRLFLQVVREESAAGVTFCYCATH